MGRGPDVPGVRRGDRSISAMLLAVTAAVVLACVAAQNFTTPLDEYIALPDPNYSYFDTVCLL